MHFAAVEAYEAQTSIQFLILEEEETGKNLDGIGALLIDVIARMAAIETLQRSFHEEITRRSFFAREVEGSMGSLTTSAGYEDFALIL